MPATWVLKSSTNASIRLVSMRRGVLPVSEHIHHPEKRVIRRLLPKHYKILELYLDGIQTKDIAEILDLNPSTVSMVIHSPLFQAEATRIRKEGRESTIMQLDRQAAMGKARSILEQASVLAAEKIEALVDSESEHISLKAATAILDRVFGPNDHKGSPPVINVTADQVNLLTLAMRETNDVRRYESPNSTATGSSQDQHRDVHQEASEPTLFDGLESAEAQDQREVA